MARFIGRVLLAMLGMVAAYWGAGIIMAPVGFLASFFATPAFTADDAYFWSTTVVPLYLGALLFYFATIRWAENRGWWAALEGAVAIAVLVPYPTFFISLLLATMASSDQSYRLTALLFLGLAGGWIIVFLLLLRRWRSGRRAAADR